jgi:hypothetical protein
LEDLIFVWLADNRDAVRGDEEAEDVFCVQFSAFKVSCVRDAALDLEMMSVVTWLFCY